MIIHRKIIDDIKRTQKRKEIIAIVGPRQVGKTTILKHFYENLKTKNSKFISFNDFDVLNLFDNNIKQFIEIYVKEVDYLFIDEIQYSKLSGKHLKLIYDEYKTKIFISGSSKSEMAIHSLQYLVGRVFIYDAHPLSFKNILKEIKKEHAFLLNKKGEQKDFILSKNEFAEYLTYGGYPEVVLTKSLTLKKEILKNIKNTYLLKEIREILDYKNLAEFENILKKLALQDGKILNKNSIAMDFGIHNNRIKEIIDVFEKTGIVQIIRPYLKNKSKELIKSPKTYLLDLGFKNSISNNFNKPSLRTDKGEIYENFILNSLIKSDLSPTYWNYKKINEMDFVIESEKGLFGFEVKSKLNKVKITPSIKKFIDLNKPKKVFVLNENLEGKKNYGDCQVIFTNHLNIFWIIENEL